MARCRSCGAAIRWLTLTNSGKPAPIDADPADNGNVRIHMGTATVLKRGEVEAAQALGEQLHLNHFATCVDRARWKKKP